ncbi:DUF6868 family protein [Shimia biformata]|uniref:DUF6868 family protein n=1 Tax=Shimia biformata TaxID=1294299 RepID=UPI00194F7CEC|nr:hypothetical protein [Shimia biformata]
MTPDFLLPFFGWMAVVNIAILTAATIGIAVMRDFATGFHAGLFGMDDAQVKAAYFRWLANYKLLTLIFNVAPYFALRLM